MNLYEGKFYSVVPEKTAHGTAWIVVKEGEQKRLFFDREKANEWAKAQDDKAIAENHQQRLF